MARARDVPGFDCGEPFARSAARLVEVRGAEVFEQAGGVLDVGEIERLHDMRVATRRLRAAMEVCAVCFPPKRYRKALRQVKALADALGERRDRDVSIEFLRGFAGEAPEAERGAVGALVERLREEQERANEDLAPHLSEERLEKLRRRLARLTDAAAT